MKIRTDFVTNSSSASFVSYQLNDSEFCRYVYAKMKEMGIDYREYLEKFNPYRPASWIYFDENSLDASICCREDGLICDDYLPEVFSPTWYFDIENITAYIEDETAQEEVKRIFENFKVFKTCEDDDLEDYENDNSEDKDRLLSYDLIGSYDEMDDGDGICTISNKDFCSQLFTLLQNSKCCDNVVKKKTVILIKEGRKKYMELTHNYVKLFCSSYDYYDAELKEIDIETMTDRFISTLSEFLPLEKIGEEEKMGQLFEKDCENGKFTCDVHMGNTD